MILWLDHKIFGNGRGLGSPYWNTRFYWVRGELYTYMGGLGAQLHSIQWRHPRAGEERRIAGRTFRPFNSRRRWGRVMVSWATRLPDNLDAAHAELRSIKNDLGENHLGKNS